MSDFDLVLQNGLHDLVENKRVRQAADCSFVNGGKYDGISGPAAIDLGKGRIGQAIETMHMQDPSGFLVVVCAEHEAVVLTGVETSLPDGQSLSVGCQDSSTSYEELRAYLPGSGKFDYQAGKDFAGFKAHMGKVGMHYTEGLDRVYDRGQRRDRVNLLCGCQVFYPETMK